MVAHHIARHLLLARHIVAWAVAGIDNTVPLLYKSQYLAAALDTLPGKVVQVRSIADFVDIVEVGENLPESRRWKARW